MKRLIIVIMLAIGSPADAGTLCDRAVHEYLKRAIQLEAEQFASAILALVPATGAISSAISREVSYRGEIDIHRLYQPMRTACYGHELYAAVEKAGWSPHSDDYGYMSIRYDAEEAAKELDALVASIRKTHAEPKH